MNSIITSNNFCACKDRIPAIDPLTIPQYAQPSPRNYANILDKVTVVEYCFSKRSYYLVTLDK
jgi:hypothetical protein